MNILGAGITGLVLGYLTDSPVYGDVIGGQLAGMPKGPRILHLDSNTEKLLRDLGINEAPETFSIGYITEEGDPIRTKLLEAEKLSYYKKTRGEDIPTKSAMSGGKTHIVGWDLNRIPLVEKLLKVVRVIPSKVHLISFDQNEVTLRDLLSGSKQTLQITDCVSTIPLLQTMRLVTNIPHELFYLYKSDKGKILKSSVGVDGLDLTCFNTSFIRVDVSQDDILPFNENFNYVYYTNYENPLNRVTRIGKSTYIFECRGDRFEAAIDYIESKGWEIGLVETIRYCQLAHSYKLVSIGLDRPEYYDNRLRLCGRFAQWDHSFKINSIFGEAKEYV